MAGEVRNFKERQKEQVLCPECRKEMTKRPLVTHHQTQHGKEKGGFGLKGDEADRGDEPKTYRIAFPAKAGPRPYPVEGCGS